jgi:pimeloyl-ACP methyl ester carboxylesterase
MAGGPNGGYRRAVTRARRLLGAAAALLLLWACGRDRSPPAGAEVEPRRAVAPDAGTSSAVPAPSAGASAMVPPAPLGSPELRAGCPLEAGEQPRRAFPLPADPAPGESTTELLLTDRRLCAREPGAREVLALRLHRLLGMEVVRAPKARVSLRVRDLDFIPWTISLDGRTPAERGEIVQALQAARDAARAGLRPPPLPRPPFELAAPPEAPRRLDGPGRPRYELALRLARTGRVDAALYWLFAAATTEGVGVKRADAEPAMAALRRDARWPTVRAFLVAAAESWAFSGGHVDPLVLPRDHAAGEPLPVAVYLHGIYSRGTLGSREQRLADRLDIALLAVDGTLPSGTGRFRWSESPELDLGRIEAALTRHAGELGPRGPLLLYGFSQGGAAAGNVALRYPERFAGVLLLSPGTATDAALDELVATPAHGRLLFRCDAAAGEAASTVRTTREYCAAAERLGARPALRLVEGATEHRLPEDFSLLFTTFARAALRAATAPRPAASASPAPAP